MNFLGDTLVERRAEYLAPQLELTINGLPAGDLVHHLTSVQVTESMGRANTATLQIQDVLLQSGPRWLDDESCQPGATICIRLGYMTRKRLMLDGYVQRVSASFSETLGPSLTLIATDRVHHALTVPVEAHLPANPTTDSDMVRQLAQNVNVEADVDPTESTFSRRRPAAATVFDYIAELAQLNGYEFYLSGGKILFKRPGSRARQPRPVLTWGKNLLGLSASMDLTGRVSRVTVRGCNPQTRDTIEGTAEPGAEPRIDPTRPRTASQLVDQHFSSPTHVISSRVPSSNREAEQIARSEQAAINRDLVTTTCEVIGDPDWQPGLEVELRGAGKRWLSGGGYRVSQADHTVGGEGYRVSLTLERNSE